MNYLDAHNKAMRRNTYYTTKIYAAIDKLKDYQEEKVESEKIAVRMLKQGQISIFPDTERIIREEEHNERMIINENGIFFSEQSVKNLEITSLCVLIVYGIIRFNKQSKEQMQHVHERFLKQYKEGEGLILPGEPEFINELIKKGVIDPENVFYIDSNEENLELVKCASFIDSKEGILEFIKIAGKEAGFTKFVIKSSILVRFPWLRKFFKKDESEVALSVPMEELRSGETKILGHILEIPQGFVNEVYKIYQKWPFLAVAMVDAIVCHEEAHRTSKITGLDDESKAASEAEASKHLLDEQGLWGVALFTWYFTYYLNTRATVEYCIEWFGFNLDGEQFKQIDELVEKIDKEYSKKGGERAKRYRRKVPSLPAELNIPNGPMKDGIFHQEGVGGVTLIPEKIEVVDEGEKAAVMGEFIEKFLILFNHFHEQYSFERDYGGDVYSERTEELYELAGKIDPKLDNETTILVEYILTWGEDPVKGEKAFSSLQEFLDRFNPYLIKYGYYFCLDITKPYRKPCFVGRLKKLEEAYVDNIKGERETVKVVSLKMVKTSEYYWHPTAPVYLLPASKEVIVFEDLLRTEAEECAERIESFREGAEDLLEELTCKQWKKIAKLPREEIIEQITKDLISSGATEGIRGAMDFFFIERPETEREDGPFIDEYKKILAQKLAGLALGSIPYYCLGKIFDEYRKGGSEQVYEDITNFFISEMEGEKEIHFFEGEKLLKGLDKFTIKEYAEKMYRRKIGGELVRGSLGKLEREDLLADLTVGSIISGEFGISSVPVDILKKVFIRTGKVGNDDTVGWDKVVKTLGLEEIKPEDVVTKKVEELITEEKWIKIVALYPYLEMVRYEEVGKTTYLSLHWNALKRLSIFNKYEELNKSRLKKEEDYIETETRKHKDLIYYSKEKIDKNKNIIDDQSHLLQVDIPRDLEKVNSKSESCEEKIRSLESEIEQLEGRHFVIGKGSKIKARQKQIETLRFDIDEGEIGKRRREMIIARSSAIEDERGLNDEIAEQRRKIKKYEEIINGLELKIEEPEKEELE